jgi:hypothetical protein
VGNALCESSSEIDLQLDNSVAQKAGIHSVQVRNPTANSEVLTYAVYQPARGPQEFLAQPSFYTSQVDPVDDAIADYNGDGFDDVVVIAGQAIYVLYGRKDGSLSPQAPSP